MSGVSRTLTYAYDRDRNRTRITHPDGNSFSYGFDGLNRMCTLTEGSTATACDASGHLRRRAWQVRERWEFDLCRLPLQDL
jgi:uncharacterized protein RhaS with RHS repeats